MMRVQSIPEIWGESFPKIFQTKTQWEKLMLHPQSLRMKIIAGLLTMKTAKRYETPCQSEHLASSFPVVSVYHIWITPFAKIQEFLGGGFNPIEKYSQNRNLPQIEVKINKYLKPHPYN